jgi:hypothetical protein
MDHVRITQPRKLASSRPQIVCRYDAELIYNIHTAIAKISCHWHCKAFSRSLPTVELLPSCGEILPDVNRIIRAVGPAMTKLSITQSHVPDSSSNDCDSRASKSFLAPVTEHNQIAIQQCRDRHNLASLFVLYECTRSCCHVWYYSLAILPKIEPERWHPTALSNGKSDRIYFAFPTSWCSEHFGATFWHMAS